MVIVILSSLALYCLRYALPNRIFQFINEEALACELAAYFYLECGENEKSVELFLQAHEKYHEWGAFGKCNSLFQFVASNFTLPAGSGLGN